MKAQSINRGETHKPLVGGSNPPAASFLFYWLPLI